VYRKYWTRDLAASGSFAAGRRCRSRAVSQLPRAGRTTILHTLRGPEGGEWPAIAELSLYRDEGRAREREHCGFNGALCMLSPQRHVPRIHPYPLSRNSIYLPHLSAHAGVCAILTFTPSVHGSGLPIHGLVGRPASTRIERGKEDDECIMHWAERPAYTPYTNRTEQ